MPACVRARLDFNEKFNAFLLRNPSRNPYLDRAGPRARLDFNEKFNAFLLRNPSRKPLARPRQLGSILMRNLMLFYSSRLPLWQGRRDR